MVGTGSVVGHRLNAMILCNPSLLPRQHPETHVWRVNDAACENGSGRPCDREPELGVWLPMLRRAQGHSSFHLPDSDSLSRHSPTSIYYHGHNTQSRDPPPSSAGLRARPSWLISRSLNRVNLVRRGRRSLGGGSSAWWPTSAAKLKYSSPEPHASQTPAGAAVLLSDHSGFPRAAATIMGLWKWALTPIHAATGSSIELVYSSKLVFLCSKYAHFNFFKRHGKLHRQRIYFKNTFDVWWTCVPNAAEIVVINRLIK